MYPVVYSNIFLGLNAEKDFDKIMNSADSLNVGGNMQGAEEDTPHKVDTFMQVKNNSYIRRLRFQQRI